ncbi:hypothetical protein MJO29_016689 [Puccinia striiformis f. sp. tritici]|nr:hypothetical protein MJO29_016689 [Puccinia striiformis f. sp. tritici]
MDRNVRGTGANTIGGGDGGEDAEGTMVTRKRSWEMLFEVAGHSLGLASGFTIRLASPPPKPERKHRNS